MYFLNQNLDLAIDRIMARLFELSHSSQRLRQSSIQSISISSAADELSCPFPLRKPVNISAPPYLVLKSPEKAVTAHRVPLARIPALFDLTLVCCSVSSIPTAAWLHSETSIMILVLMTIIE